MTFTVLLEGRNGHFIASLVGAPNLSVVEPTRAQAIASLKAEIQQRIELSELLELEIDLNRRNHPGQIECHPAGRSR